MSSPSTPEPSTFDDGELYDVLCTGLTYGLEFYVDLAREAKGPVLDIACGTGRILLPCAQAGVDIDGLDLYEGMLAPLRKKAAALGLSPTLYQADMGDFRLPRRYARARDLPRARLLGAQTLSPRGLTRQGVRGRAADLNGDSRRLRASCGRERK